jgi:hypothetical protein
LTVAEERKGVPICSILVDIEKAAISLLERPMMLPDLIRAERTISHIAEARQTICPAVKPEEVVPEPYKARFCETIKRTLENTIRTAEERGIIEDPERFTSLIYWSRRLKEAYKCPEG